MLSEFRKFIGFKITTAGSLKAKHVAMGKPSQRISLENVAKATRAALECA